MLILVSSATSGLNAEEASGTGPAPLQGQVQAQYDGKRIRNAVAAFTGRDIADALIEERPHWLGPFKRIHYFRLPETDELFRVRARDMSVQYWSLGSFLPDLDAPLTAPREYERLFIDRYMPEAANEAMTLITSTEGAEVPVRGFVYALALRKGVYAPTTHCSFVWDEQMRRVKVFRRCHEPVYIDTTPEVSFEDAYDAVSRFVRAWEGVAGVEIDVSQAHVDEAFLRAARVVSDEAECQRLAYILPIELDWRAETDGSDAEDYGGDGRPRYGAVLIDAHTGHPFAPHAQATWGAQAAGDRLEVRLVEDGFAGMFELFYMPRLRDGTLYMCAMYFGTLMWDGAIEFDADTGKFTITHKGHTWAGVIGENTLAAPDGELASAAPVLLIEDVPYLPWDMIEAITGWRAQFAHDALMGGTVVLYPEDELPADEVTGATVLPPNVVPQ